MSPAPIAPACLLAAALAVLILGGAAEGGVFRFEDDDGVIHYTNAPSDPRFRRIPEWPEATPPVPPAPRIGPAAAFFDVIEAAAGRYGVDRRLVEAVVVVESAGNPRAVSPKGATGLMQLMPARAAALGVRDPFDPIQNLDGGVRHLRDLLERFAGNLTLALAAYNAGEEAVRTHRGVPPFRETQEYVRKIFALYTREDAAPPAPSPVAPERVYRRVTDDGTIVYTNLPPAPALLGKPGL